LDFDRQFLMRLLKFEQQTVKIQHLSIFSNALFLKFWFNIGCFTEHNYRTPEWNCSIIQPPRWGREQVASSCFLPLSILTENSLGWASDIFKRVIKTDTAPAFSPRGNKRTINLQDSYLWMKPFGAVFGLTNSLVIIFFVDAAKRQRGTEGGEKMHICWAAQALCFQLPCWMAGDFTVYLNVSLIQMVESLLEGWETRD